jgi:hypothetical protein
VERCARGTGTRDPCDVEDDSCMKGSASVGMLSELHMFSYVAIWLYKVHSSAGR